MQDQQQLLDTVVTSQAAVTKASLPRRYRLHRYRGPAVTHRYTYTVTPLQLTVTGLTTVVTEPAVTLSLQATPLQGARRYPSLQATPLRRYSSPLQA